MLRFIREQEERLALRLLAWQYQKNKMAHYHRLLNWHAKPLH